MKSPVKPGGMGALLACTLAAISLALIPGWTRAAPAYGIGTMAAFWSLQRMAALF